MTESSQMAAGQEPRLFGERGVDARVASIVEPVIVDLGFDLVRVRITGERGCTVQIMAESPDGTMSIEGCEAVSKAISPALDVEDPISGEYHLEVSSPGVDRPLVRRRDFIAWAGHEAKIELSTPVDGRRRYRGMLDGVDGEDLKIVLPDVPQGTDANVRVPLSNLSEAKLVMNDKLLELALKAQPVNGAAEIEEDAADRQE
ncbi:ribosome maturation factor RimP [Cohaesibacter sp. ES.047]|uniref:ribosome maturation factor RimP n=1 Tax=Cohaesibacter sp. ES.047 TaxID=1798205 RepID=UPI000BBFA073|nr:ribosome maturation factor RimP [Cohaesibacter sp. ES.047]SNY90393.1 ribosome maturation factor RimP [Cohaesibacter sp. ES.047]